MILNEIMKKKDYVVILDKKLLGIKGRYMKLEYALKWAE